MPEGQVNWLLVGTGDIVKKRAAAALTNAPNSRITAISARNRERAEALAGQIGASAVFTDFDQALAEADANAVYLATPAGTHIPLAIAAMRAGKHVLVEKPLGLNGKECREAAAIAEQTGVVAGCAYYRRFFPRYENAQQMLAAGELGKILLIRMIYRSWQCVGPEDPKRWRYSRSLAGGGPTADMGSHMLDIMIGLVGMPASVFAKADNLVHEWEVEDSCTVLMTLPGGTHVSAGFYWNSKTWSHELEIVGEDASLKWAPCDTGKVVKTVGRETREYDMPNAKNVHLPMVEDFVNAVIEHRPARVSLAEATKTNIVLDAIYESSRTGKQVRL